MASKIELELIAATEKAVGELNKAKGAIEGVGSTASTVGKSNLKDFGGFAKEMGGDLAKAAGIVAGSAALIKKALDFGEEGAVIQQTSDSFDGLIQRAGVSADLLEQLDAAALGTVDSMTLMSGTLTLAAGTSGELQKELLEATPELMEIAKAANKLNPTLGDTAHMYESIATGIKRSSPLILDNLGLTIKVGVANEQYAASIGKTVEELTAEEKQMAMLNAALEAGDTLIAQVGGTTDSSADSFAQMNANITEAGDNIKLMLLPPLSEAAGAINTLFGAMNIGNTVQEHAADVAKTAGSYQEYAEEINRAANAAGMYVSESGDLLNMHGALVESGYQLTQSEYAAIQAMNGMPFAATEASTAMVKEFQVMKKNGIDPAGKSVGGILGGLQDINGMSVTATVHINTVGSVPSIYGAAAPTSATGATGEWSETHGRASGGPVFSGQSYWVGEEGPEVFSPGTSGNITPNDKIGGDNAALLDAMDRNTSLLGNLPNMIVEALDRRS